MDEEEQKEKVKEEKVLEVNSATGEVRCCTAKSLPNDKEDKEEAKQ